MLRENFVGTIFEMDMTGMPGWAEGKRPVLITAFLGEGAEAVVFGIAPLHDPTQAQRAVKIFKPAPFLEMQTLHHGFTVHTDLYPDHPLAMSADDRLAMLTTEMMAKVDDGHLVFSIEFYREIIDTTVTVLARAFAEAAAEPVSLDDSPVREWIDDNVVYRISELLDEDAVIPEFFAHLGQARDEAEQAIARWQAAGTYAPLPGNPLVTLTGLLFEGFISHDEYRLLSRSSQFAARAAPQHVEGFFQAIATFYFRLSSHDKSGQSAKTLARVPAAVSACDLLLDFGALVPDRAEWYAALACNWKARFLMLAKEPLDVVEPLLRSALDSWRRQGELAQLHDVLKDFAAAHWPADPETTVRYLNAAERVRHVLDRI